MSYENWNEVIVRLNRTTELNSFLTLIGNSNLVPSYRTHPINKRGKILIIGDAKQSVNDIEKVCKEEYGITKNRLELVLEYTKKYDFKKLQYNTNYTAILVGPLPHKTVGQCNGSSIIVEMEKGEGYPPIIRLVNSQNELHISKNNIRQAMKTLVESGLIEKNHQSVN